MQPKTIVGLLAGCVALATVPALAEPADDAARAFADGKTLLVEAKFDEASEAFRTAAKSDAGNQEYHQAYATLRQVIRMRGEIDKEQDFDRWTSMARALRTFYHDHEIYSESLPLDRRIHEQHLAPNSAAMLAETLLALGKNSEAAEMLSNLGENETTVRTNVLWGLALARQGRIDEAKAASSKVDVENVAGPRVFYELACVRALSGDSQGSFAALTRSFELTPPSRLDAFKAKAKECKDFNALARDAGFAEALQTQSEVKESGCSKGPACGKCPKRATCGGKNTENEKANP